MSIAWTLIAAVLLQVGYLGFVFRLVYGRRRREQKREEADPNATKQRPFHTSDDISKAN